MACTKTSDNKHFYCPPRMADGRHFTDYRPSCHVNDLLRNDNNISNSFQYRSFMTHNAETIMDKHRQIACSKNCCTPCASSPLGVEGFKLWVFCCSDFLGNKVISTKIESKTNNTDGTCPKTHNRNKQHKEMQPPLITKRNAKDLRPETVCRNH